MKYMYLLLLLSFCSFSNAIEYEKKIEGSNVLGTTTFYKMKKSETMRDVAEKHGVSVMQLTALNPLADPITGRDLTLEIPRRLILPDAENDGIVVNLAELRLYYFPENKNKVYVFPVGVGRIGWETPVMETSIGQMIKNPTWTPTPRIRAAHFEKHGKHLPDVMPAGPDNPLGQHAMRLRHGDGSYLIHGTNRTVGTGMRISSGCIRMNPPDVEWLFSQVGKGTQVQIINQPFKYTTEIDGSIYVEVHEPMSKNWSEAKKFKPIFAPKELEEKITEDQKAFYSLGFALQNQTGVPLRIK